MQTETLSERSEKQTQAELVALSRAVAKAQGGGRDRARGRAVRLVLSVANPRPLDAEWHSHTAMKWIAGRRH